MDEQFTVEEAIKIAESSWAFSTATLEGAAEVLERHEREQYERGSRRLYKLNATIQERRKKEMNS